MKDIADRNFRYANAAETAKPGYLRRKWLRAYPGCFNAPAVKIERPSDVVRLEYKIAKK